MTDLHRARLAAAIDHLRELFSTPWEELSPPARERLLAKGYTPEEWTPLPAREPTRLRLVSGRSDPTVAPWRCAGDFGPAGTCVAIYVGSEAHWTCRLCGTHNPPRISL